VIQARRAHKAFLVHQGDKVLKVILVRADPPGSKGQKVRKAIEDNKARPAYCKCSTADL
jgi:hypothetical protein